LQDKTQSMNNIQEQQREHSVKNDNADLSWEEQYAMYCAEKEAKLRLLDEEERKRKMEPE
jgi:hypothetical protein